MKRYGYLFEKICTIENIAETHRNARKGKTHYREVQKIDRNPGKYFALIRSMLLDHTFRNSKYTVFKLYDSGKERIIHKLPYFPDRIIHHAIMQIIEPIWKNTLIKDTFSSIKGRGIHKGVRKLKAALTNERATKYCLKLDISKYYPSINHDVLKQIIRKKIKDPELLLLLDEIIDSAPGVPIGNYLSQYFANLYLTEFDHWVKEELGIKWYFRYCDDLVIFGRSKERLRWVLSRVQFYIQCFLKLRVKRNYQIFPIESRGVDFLGYVFRHNYVLVRRKIRDRCIKAIKGNIQDIHKGLTSYFGWFIHCNGYNLRHSLLNISFQRRMRRHCWAMDLQNPIRRYI